MHAMQIGAGILHPSYQSNHIHNKLEPQKNLYCSFMSNFDLCLGSRSLSDRCNLLQLPNDNYNASLDQGIHFKKLVESWCKY